MSSNSHVSVPEESALSQMENEGGLSPAHLPSEGAVGDQLVALGIACVQSTIFEWGGYRYTNAHDAIAAAKRGRAS